MEEKVNMGRLSQHDKMLVGVSGGKDSIALLHYLRFKAGINIMACHINHNLRGIESQRDMDFVIDICKEWNIPCFTKSVNISGYALSKKISLEEAGREVRYSFFREMKQKYKLDKIATAHTLSDNIETVIFRMTRGTGLKGICGIPFETDEFIRPLLYCTTSDIENYCHQNSLHHINDSSNETDNYTRNNIRHNVIPVLEGINKNFSSCFARTIDNINQDEDFLEQQVQLLLEESKTQQGYNIIRLQKSHIAIRRRAIKYFLDAHEIPISHMQILAIERIILLGMGKINVSKNNFIEVKNKILRIVDEKTPIEYFETYFQEGFFSCSDEEKYENIICDRKKFEKIEKVYKKLFFIFVDYDKIIGKVIIRQKKSGDKIKLPNRSYNKTIKKIFLEQKVSKYERSKTLVISDDIGVIAVFGIGVNERVCVDNNTEKFLVIAKTTN